MRSGTTCNINSGQVYSWASGLLLDAKLVKDHGWKCSAAIVLGITLRASARCISLNAACRDLAHAPSEQAVLTALDEGLSKTLIVLERRLNDALIDPLPKRMRRRAWNIAIDWHLQPYYGEPCRGVDSSEPLGLDSSHSPCRRIGRHHDIASGTVEFQTNARMDYPRNCCLISRRLNTLRHSAAVNQS